MKNLFHTSKIIIVFVFMIIVSMSLVLASSSVSFATDVSLEYNILATVSEGTAIDTTVQSKIKFNLYESVEDIYYNGHLVDIVNDSFEINIDGLHGKTTFTFTNDKNESADFTYYLSDSGGFLENFELLKGHSVDSYIITYNGIQIIYTDQDNESLSDLKEYLDSLPDVLLQNVSMIKMIPYKNHSRIAGVTKNDTITLYKFSQYSRKTQQNIIIHEIAHTFANRLIEEGTIDYSFSEYYKVVQLDKNAVSHYAKRSTDNTGRPSEDFADSIAFYFINPAFSKLFPNRTNYIESLLNM